MERRVAICGMSPSAGECPREGWEVWALAWDRTRMEFADKCFEIHKRDMWDKYGGWKDAEAYTEHLRSITIPCYMQEKFPDIPQSLAFPIDSMLGMDGEHVGDLSRDYFGSSIAYMIAMAWYERVDRLGIWGVELSQADYHHQRPNLEYWIGRCEERGIPVEVHGQRGFLMKLCAHPAHNGKKYLRYGWIEAQ